MPERKHLRVDPARRLNGREPKLGQYTRAFDENGRAATVAVEELDRESLLIWIRSRYSYVFIENVVGHLLGYGELHRRAALGNYPAEVPQLEEIEAARVAVGLLNALYEQAEQSWPKLGRTSYQEGWMDALDLAAQRLAEGQPQECESVRSPPGEMGELTGPPWPSPTELRAQLDASTQDAERAATRAERERLGLAAADIVKRYIDDKLKTPDLIEEFRSLLAANPQWPFPLVQERCSLCGKQGRFVNDVCGRCFDRLTGPGFEAAIRADERERIALRLERDHIPGSYPYDLAKRVRANDMPGPDVPRGAPRDKGDALARRAKVGET